MVEVWNDNVCPVCGSQNIEGDAYEWFPNGLMQYCRCTDCWSSWDCVYTFAGCDDICDANGESVSIGSE